MPPQQQPFPEMPPQEPAPVASNGGFSVKGFSRKTESYSEQKSGSKTTETEYESKGSWDDSNFAARGGRFEQGRLMFSPPQSPVSLAVPAEQQAQISAASVGYQNRCGFYDLAGRAGTCGYVPNVTNYVSLPSQYMPNACNRCVAIRSGNTVIKALVADGYGGPEKFIRASAGLCPSLGVDPTAQLKVDWDFVAC